jgi:hypothetical protein
MAGNQQNNSRTQIPEEEKTGYKPVSVINPISRRGLLDAAESSSQAYSIKTTNPKVAIDPEFEAMIAKFEENAKTRNDSISNPLTIPKKYQASDETSRWINKRKNEITLQDFRIKAKLG